MGIYFGKEKARLYLGGYLSKPEEEKTVTANTEVLEVTPSQNKTLSKVTINPTPSEAKEVNAGIEDITVLPSEGKLLSEVIVNPTPSQLKEVTPSEVAQTIIPDSGKLLSSVTVSAIQTEEKDVVAGTTIQTIAPTTGKYIKSIRVNPTPSQIKNTAPAATDTTVMPDDGKLLSSVVVNGDSNFIEENIKEGITIWGKTGTLISKNNTGKYAWRKKERKDEYVDNRVTITAHKQGYSEQYQEYNGAMVDITPDPLSYTVKESDLYNLDLAWDLNPQYHYIFKSDKTGYQYHTDNPDASLTGSTYTWRYDSSRKQILMIGYDDSNEATGSKIIGQIDTVTTYPVIGYSVSDNSSDYPSDGKHTDGYYYTRIS